jgi:hypothetical protein
MNRHRRPVVTQTLAALAALAALASLACLTQTTPASAAAVDGCLTTRSASDFNGDGFDDAAVGDPYATVNGKSEAGSVTVLFGNADGRIGNGARQVITQTDLGDTRKPATTSASTSCWRPLTSTTAAPTCWSACRARTSVPARTPASPT